MIRSQNELLSIALKAARGAGVPLGLAEDFAAALSFVARDDLLAAVKVLGADLRSPDADWKDTVLIIANGQALACGPASIDAMRCDLDKVQIAHIDCLPLLKAYFDWAHQIHGLQLGINKTAVGYEVQSVTDRPPAEPFGARVIPETVWGYLNTFAQKTYVPASEASRLSGAGAGLTDND